VAISRPAPTAAFLHPSTRALRRSANAGAATAPRTRRTPSRPTSRSSLGPPPAVPPPAVWQLDRHELTTALEHSRW
jgi:hypothetical protein